VVVMVLVQYIILQKPKMSCESNCTNVRNAMRMCVLQMLLLVRRQILTRSNPIC